MHHGGPLRTRSFVLFRDHPLRTALEPKDWPRARLGLESGQNLKSRKRIFYVFWTDGRRLPEITFYSKFTRFFCQDKAIFLSIFAVYFACTRTRVYFLLRTTLVRIPAFCCPPYHTPRQNFSKIFLSAEFQLHYRLCSQIRRINELK